MTGTPDASRRLIFDIEADGLLHDITKVHCICAIDIATNEQFQWGPKEIEEGVKFLYDAEELIAHNGIGYDFKALEKVTGFRRRPGQKWSDTMIMARVIYPDIKEADFARKMTGKLIGSHSLEAWGKRIGVEKWDYQGEWKEWTPEMQSYCMQDVLVTYALYRYLRPQDYPQMPLELMHRVATVTAAMEYQGWTFNEKAAFELYAKLVKRKDQIETELINKFGSWQEVDKIITPKRDNAKLGYTAGVPVTKYKTVTFNPGSRQHIERVLRLAGWEPKEFTASGQAKLDEKVLESLEFPEAKAIAEYFLIQKRLGQLADGDQGWLKVVKKGRIHGRYIVNGTVTGRCAHSSPNIAQVPANRAPYGHECRSLFTVPDGWKLVGADMAGLELRTFANALALFDGGDYAKVVCEGDVHTHNQTMFGVPTRDMAKTTVYALIYGAGNAKLGLIVNGTSKDGERIRQNFMSGVPAYKALVESVGAAAKRGYVKGLDGRKIPCRSEHSALNSVLQNYGAVLTAEWVASTYETLLKLGYKHGYDGDFVFCGWIHDEVQIACKSTLANIIGTIVVECAETAGEPYGFKVPLKSDYVIGTNWSETH